MSKHTETIEEWIVLREGTGCCHALEATRIVRAILDECSELRQSRYGMNVGIIADNLEETIALVITGGEGEE